MDFSELCQLFKKIEDESGRLKKISLLEEILRRADPGEVRMIIELSLGRFGPDYDLLVLGIKDSFLLNAIVRLNGISKETVEEMYRKVGDVGEVAEMTESLIGKQTVLDDFFSDAPAEASPLSVGDVYRNIEKIASVAGERSTSAKIDVIGQVDKRLQPLERRYYYRALVGRMRLGLKQSSWLAALANYLGGSEHKEALELAYYLNSDLSLVASTCMEKGLKGIKELSKIRPGVPVHPMLAQRVSSGEEGLERIPEGVYVETKYDGYRLLIHRDEGGEVTLWSRNLESYTSIFPELVEAFGISMSCPVVLDGEVVAYDYEKDHALNFQVLAQRSRKYDIQKMVETVSVKVFLFDILHYDGDDLIHLPYLERRKILDRVCPEIDLVSVSGVRRCETAEDIDELLLEAKEENQEGIMLKDPSPHSVYEPGKRSYFWLKYKADYKEALGDSFDLVVVGGYYGAGKRAGVVGAFLMAAYDPETGEYYSFCKVGTGFSEEDLDELTQRVKDIKVDAKPSNYYMKEEPDFWVLPDVILEISAAEISRSPKHTVPSSEGHGLALRFPRYMGRVRDDKTVPDGVTTIQEIIELSSKMKIGG